MAEPPPLNERGPARYDLEVSLLQALVAFRTRCAQKARRGLAAVSPERRREISRMGAQAQHARGTAPRFDSDSGRAAGKLGGAGKHKK